MSGNREVTYAVDFRAGRRRNKIASSPRHPPDNETIGCSLPRIARLLALAIRFEGLLREETMQDYAELARLGRVSRARITQIMKLLDLAPDIQEQILFLPPVSRQNGKGLNERNLRPIVSRIDWSEQRRLFQKISELSPSLKIVGMVPNEREALVQRTGSISFIGFTPNACASATMLRKAMLRSPRSTPPM